MSKSISLSRRRPAFPAPTSSAAIRNPAVRHAVKVLAKPLHVLDRLALGQLEDDPIGRQAVATEDRNQLAHAELIGLQRARGEIHAQVRISKPGADRRGDDVDGEDVELDRAIGDLRRGEEGRRVAEVRALTRSDQALEADGPAGGEIEDRLKDGRQRALAGYLVDGLGELRRRAGVIRYAVALGIEDLDIGAAVTLRPVQGCIGVAEKASPILARDGKAETPAEKEKERPMVASAESADESTRRITA